MRYLTMIHQAGLFLGAGIRKHLRFLRQAAAAGLGLLLVAGGGRGMAASLSDFIPWYYDVYNDGTVQFYGRLHVPSDYDSDQSYALVVHYHGLGEKIELDADGNPVNVDEQVTVSNINNLLAAAKSRKFFLYAPQAGTGGWNPAALKNTAQMTAKIMATYNIDPARLYVTGLSLGGGATWNTLEDYAGVYAAAVPICGAHVTVDHSLLVDVPIWAFHAQDDGVVSENTTRARVNGIRQADGLAALSFPLNDNPSEPHYNTGAPYYIDGGTGTSYGTFYDFHNLKYTEFFGGGHGIWDEVYGQKTPGNATLTYPLYDWLFSHTQEVTSVEAGEKILFDFGSSSMSTVDSQGRWWNTTTSGLERTLGVQVEPFALTAEGRRTFIVAEVVDTFGGHDTAGVVTGSMYDQNVARDSWRTASAADGGAVKIRGLIPGAVYRLQFFASCANDDGGRGRMTRYQVGSQHVDLDPVNNLTTTVALEEVAADASGAIVLQVTTQPGSTARYGHLGALELTLVSAGGGGEEAPAMYQQNFDGSAVLADYHDAAAPTAGQVNHISSNWAINAGKLRLVQTSATGSTGFSRIVQAGQTPSVVAVSFTVALSNLTSTYNNLANFDLANLTSIPSYGGSIPNVAMGSQLVIKGVGSGFRFRFNSTNSVQTYAADGTAVAVEWYTNRSGAPVTYETPAGGTKELASGFSDVWVNGVAIFSDAAVPSVYGSDTMGGFRFQYTNSQNATLDLDEIGVWDLTQP